MFELEAVAKSFGETVAVRATTLSVHAGETLVLIGPSGCGKSTLLRLMLGLIAPDSGRVRFDGGPLDARTMREARRRIGYVIQDGGLFPHLSAERNVTLMARRHGWAAERVAARLGELAALTDFPADAFGRYPVQLSGGQRQRVALMRALMLDPDALLLDEPLGALDPMVRFELQRDLRAIFRRLGKTVVIVTHDLAEAGYFGSRLALMREGEIVQCGPAAELTDAPATPFVRDFFDAQRGLHALGGEGAS